METKFNAAMIINLINHIMDKAKSMTNLDTTGLSNGLNDVLNYGAECINLIKNNDFKRVIMEFDDNKFANSLLALIKELTVTWALAAEKPGGLEREDKITSYEGRTTFIAHMNGEFEFCDPDGAADAIQVRREDILDIAAGYGKAAVSKGDLAKIHQMRIDYKGMALWLSSGAMFDVCMLDFPNCEVTGQSICIKCYCEFDGKDGSHVCPNCK